MADTINVSLSALASILSNPIALSKTFSITLSGTSYMATRQSIPTGATAEAFQKGEITTIKYAYVVNEDPTNFVKVLNQATVSGAVVLSEIGPGEGIWIRPNATNIYCIADTGSCNINFELFGG